MNFESLEILLATAKTKSIARASELLDMAPSSISRKIRLLEDDLKTELFYRGSKELTITCQGQDVVAWAERTLSETEQMRNLIQGNQELTGSIKMLMPSGFADRLTQRFLVPFKKRYPNIELKVTISQGRQIDTLLGNDIAFSPNLPLDTSLIAKRLFRGKRYFVAGTEFLNTNGTPQNPDELCNYPFMPLLNASYHGGVQYWDNGENLSGQFKVNSIVSSDSPDLLANMVVENIGISCLSVAMFGRFPKSSFVTLFGDEVFHLGYLYAIFPSREHRPHRVSVFVDELSQFLSAAQK